MSKLEEKAEVLRKALKKLGLRQVEFAAVTGRSDVQIGKMCRGDCGIPEYIWAFIYLFQQLDKLAPHGWLKAHVERSRKIQGL